jgi:acyl carrier protein
MASSVESTALRTRVLELLTGIAPDIDPATIDPARELRDQFDFDSMDRLHFAVAISEAFGIDIPEEDYRQLAALQQACEYIEGKLRQKPGKPDTSHPSA